MTETAAARRAAGQRRLSGATAALTAASLGGTGLVVAALVGTGGTSAPGVGAQQPRAVQAEEVSYDDDSGRFAVPRQVPVGSVLPPVASTTGS